MSELPRDTMTHNYEYNLGDHGRTITTDSPEAQLWFDRGLVWTYGYHHEEAVRCFTEALRSDPDCAMAHWGIAYAAGPNYNKPWDKFDELDLVDTVDRVHRSIQAAQACSAGASPTEQALIESLACRYPSSQPVDDFSPWTDSFAAAMRDVYRRFPADLDIATLFAEALINRTPWSLWDLDTGLPAEDADTLEAVDVLESALAQMADRTVKDHPGVLHMYIHVMEMSPYPERALTAADQLRDLVPDAGHLQHMPSHIDVQCGDYSATVRANTAAIVADRKCLERDGPLNFYTAYRVHDLHFKVFGAMMLGHRAAAMEAADELVASVPEALLRIESPRMADWVEAYVSVRSHALIRFGGWDEIIAEPLPSDPELYCMTTAIGHYSKAVAHAASGNVASAEQESTLFAAAVERVPETRTLFNNTCQEILAIAGEMQRGEIEYRRGAHDLAFTHLRRSVELDDQLPYSEPWGWMQPARHALGALLLEQGRVEEAEEVYRSDLGLDSTTRRARQHRDNLWSLHGLHECLERLGRRAEADMIKPRLDVAVARSDIPVVASCFCRSDIADGAR